MFGRMDILLHSRSKGSKSYGNNYAQSKQSFQLYAKINVYQYLFQEIAYKSVTTVHKRDVPQLFFIWTYVYAYAF